jgi:uncharacterized protein
VRRLVLILLLIWPAFVRAETYPDYVSTYVNDFADLLDPEAEARVEAALKQVEAERGVEMTLVTIRSRHDYDAAGDIADYATNLFNRWGVGDPTRNDGILILVAVDDRDMRIALGAGYPPAFDDRMQAVIDHYFLPWFRNGHYGSGIESGVDETIKRSALDYTEPADGSAPSDGGDIFLRYVLPGLGGVLGLGALGGGGYWLNRRWTRHRPRYCPKCGKRMDRLDEAEDDNHLAKGQRVEETLASVDYDVWLCRDDGASIVESYPHFWGHKPLCPDCGYHTLNAMRRTLHAATTSAEGLAEVTYDCAHCGHHRVTTVAIPVRTESSSSSGGSSFSGGSSSGGGASGSW